MNINGQHYRTIWLAEDNQTVEIIDQTKLPHDFEIVSLKTMPDAAYAIKEMLVRGAPLIGVTAAYGVALAMHEDPSDVYLAKACNILFQTRPTAVNLRWALDEMKKLLEPLPMKERVKAAYTRAAEIADEDVNICSRIGDHGFNIIQTLWEQKGKPDQFNIMTHCNAGWLATVDWGTALSPIYKAHDAGLPVHVWVSETRPRNQGFHLTAWELNCHGVDHTMIVDNVAGHLMQHHMVDMCIVGSDRTTRQGDVCNKIGTYLKALAAHANDVPFYIGLPGPTIDWTISDGIKDIPIETRDVNEVKHITGSTQNDRREKIGVTPKTSNAINFGFDVTPARYVTGLITERGVAQANEQSLLKLYPEQA